jgi:PAS domain-containing protein
MNVGVGLFGERKVEHAMRLQASCGELQHLVTVTALMMDPVLACDERGKMVFANLAALQLFGEIDTEHDCVDDCPGVLGIVDLKGERPLQPLELPLAQAAYQGRTAQATLLVLQDGGAAAVEATAFPVLDPSGQQVGAMMVCHSLEASSLGAQLRYWA